MFKIDNDSFLLKSCNVYWGREERWQIAELPNFIMELELCRYSDYRSVRIINGIYWDSVANQLKKCGYKIFNYCNGDTEIERPHQRNVEIDNATKEYICIWYNEKPDWWKEKLLRLYPSLSLIVQS
jgi:hypothetical protein